MDWKKRVNGLLWPGSTFRPDDSVRGPVPDTFQPPSRLFLITAGRSRHIGDAPWLSPLFAVAE